MKISIIIAAVAAAVAAADAMAGSATYTRNGPLTVTDSQRSNGTFFLVATDNGGSGLAYVEIDGTALFGTFPLVGRRNCPKERETFSSGTFIRSGS